MKIRTISENVIQLTRLRFVNAYLVQEDGGFTLVDTGLGGAADTLLTIARRNGAEIRRIALTHGHEDHAGSLDAMRKQLGSEVEISVSGLDARECAGEHVNRTYCRTEIPNRAAQPFPLAAMDAAIRRAAR